MANDKVQISSEKKDVFLVVMDSGIPASVPHLEMTRLAFLNRLDPELETIYEAAQAVIRIKIFIDKVLASKCINPADEKTIAGMNALVAANLITQERADIVLGTPITDIEAYD